MEGIQQMFHEFSQPDEYQLQFAFERYAREHYGDRKDTQRLYQRSAKGREVARRHEAKPERKEAKRKWAAAYYKRRLREDPAWAARLRARRNKLSKAHRERKRMAS